MNSAIEPCDGSSPDEALKDMKILETLRKPTAAAAVIAAVSLPRATLYRRLANLEQRGLIFKTGELYELGPAGLAALKTRKMPNPERPLSRMWAWLALLPLPKFRALATLVLFAMAARRANLGDDRNPGFILLGPTQRLKSWISKILCFRAGSTPDKCRQPMQSIRQRGLIGRLDGHGGLAYTSKAIEEPILWLEEVSLAESGVYRDITALLQGPRIIKIENQEVDIPAIPLLELNPLKTAGTLQERTGMDVPRLRRTIILDFEHCAVTDAMRRAAKGVLDQISAMGPLVMAEPARGPLSLRASELMDAGLGACVRPEMRDYMDPGRISTLILGGRAVLPELDAVAESLLSWCECAESAGLVVANWRCALAEVLRIDGERNPEVATSVSAPLSVEPANTSHSTGASMEPKSVQPSVCNPYLQSDVLLKLNQLINDAGLRVPDDDHAISGALKVIVSLKRAKMPYAGLLRNPKYWMEIIKADSFLKSNHLTPDKIKIIQAAHETLMKNFKDCVKTDEMNKEFYELYLQLCRFGFSKSTAGAWMARLYCEIFERPFGKGVETQFIFDEGDSEIVITIEQRLPLKPEADPVLPE